VCCGHVRVFLQPVKGDVHLGDRLEGWKGFFDLAADLHPITRAALGFYIWPMAGIGPEGERLEAAVLAARVAHRIVGLGWSLFLRQQAAVAGCGLAVTL